MSYRALGNVLKKVADTPEPLIVTLFDLLEKLNSSRGNVWWEELMKFLRKEPCWVSKPLATLSLAEMIRVGSYDWVNVNIKEANFPMPEGFTLGTEPKLYHFNRSISSENAIEEMKKDGFRPATIWDLLDYGAKNPELQRLFPMVALGSVEEVGGNRSVACLYGGGAKRYLSLGWFVIDWGDDHRFLAVRN